jgi:hypothetical protein
MAARHLTAAPVTLLPNILYCSSDQERWIDGKEDAWA